MKDCIYNKNSYYEGLIQNLFGGSDGCFCLFMTFFYQLNQSVVFKIELEPCFRELCDIERENCLILSQLLIEMGGDNKFCSHSKKFLSGYNVDYLKNFSKIFLYDIEKIEVHIIQIKSMILKVDDENVKEKLISVLKNKQKCLKILRENYFKNNVLKN